MFMEYTLRVWTKLTTPSRLILIESRIHRLSRYYKTVGALPPTWRYESATASTLVA